mgnify:CR=1 FL=1
MLLLKGEDLNKDQSYFLHKLNQQQISSALFPIGKLKKKFVRMFANKYRFLNYNKRDSVGICFIGKRDLITFLSKYIPKNPRQRAPAPPYSGEKFTQDDKGRNIIPKSMQLKDLIEKFKDTPLGQKFAFNPVMNAVEELAEDWDIEIVDLHNANVMKRANGQVVFVDIGLFVTKQRPVTQKPQPATPVPSSSPSNNPWESGNMLKKPSGEAWQSGRGLYESKNRKIKIKILDKIENI